jgi:beta-phosphoglucomutase-like phosphatase (HAD superfamily)
VANTSAANTRPTQPSISQHWQAPDDCAALIFDCDGTLADTMPIHFAAWVEALAPVGLMFSETQFYALGGMSSEKIIAMLSAEQSVPVADPRALAERKELLYLHRLDEVAPVPEVVEVAQRYSGKLPMAVGSGGERWVVEKTLRAIGIYDLFATVVGSDDTERHKPEPDVFLEGARRLQVEAASCVVFEDTELGLEAARRAGMLGVDIRPWRVQQND